MSDYELDAFLRFVLGRKWLFLEIRALAFSICSLQVCLILRHTLRNVTVSHHCTE